MINYSDIIRNNKSINDSSNQKSEIKTQEKSIQQPNNESKESQQNETSIQEHSIPNPISQNNFNDNKLIIVRYLKTQLFFKNDKLLIINNEDKSKIKGNLIEFTQKFIKSSSTDFLYYTIRYNPDNPNFIVEGFNSGTSIQKLPKTISIQMMPNSKFPYLIFVVCNIKEIETSFKLNENCFSIAIKFDPKKDDNQTLKQKVINYLRMSDKITNCNPIIYTYRNNKFEIPPKNNTR